MIRGRVQKAVRASDGVIRRMLASGQSGCIQYKVGWSDLALIRFSKTNGEKENAKTIFLNYFFRPPEGYKLFLTWLKKKYFFSNFPLFFA